MSAVNLPDALTPYLEESTERVLEANDLDGELTLTCGLDVERMDITVDGVIVSAFTRFTEATPDNRNTHLRLINQHAVEGVDDVTLVWERGQAVERDDRCVWVMTDGEAIEYSHPFAGSERSFGADHVRLPTDVYVYERLPFSESVESIEQLEEELETVLSGLSESSVSVTLD